jgi:hypothetical protein
MDFAKAYFIGLTIAFTIGPISSSRNFNLFDGSATR